MAENVSSPRDGLPSILVFLLAYGAGLATGLSHFMGGLGVGLTSLALAPRRARGLLLTGALAGGLIGALYQYHRAQLCENAWSEGWGTVQVRVTSSRSRIGLGTPLGAGCRGSIRLRWPSARRVPMDGSLVRVTGRWIPLSPGQGVLASTSFSVVEPPGSASRRHQLAQRVRRLFGAQAGMVEAMVLGERSDLDPSIRAAFVDSGLVHLLAISGFHVGLVAGWAFLCARMLALGRRSAGIVAVAVAVGYAGFLGWPVPATRAAIMIATVALGRIRQRAIRPVGLWGTSALLLLVLQPGAIEEPGAWLSFAAVWGTTAGGRWVGRLRWTHPIARLLASSVGATAATAPITATVFGAVAPVGILLNLVAIPLAALIVPGLIASLALADLLPVVARGLAEGSGLLLWVLAQTAEVGSRIWWGQWRAAPGPDAALGPLSILLVLTWITARGTATAAEAFRRFGWSLATVGVISIVPALWRSEGHAAGSLSLHFLDVGQGDAIVVETPGRRFVLVDAGPRSERYDAGRRIVGPYLRRLHARRLAGVIVSHVHLDHLGGLRSILERFSTGWIMEPLVAVPDPNYLAFLDQVASRGVPLIPARKGMDWTLDGVHWQVVHPDTSLRSWGLDLNEDSAMLLIEFGRFRALLTGDAGLPAEGVLAGTIGEVTLLKVGHHGSRSATGTSWLEELSPALAVISSGRNSFGHPAPEVVQRLAAVGATVWRTDREGTITVTTDGRSVTVGGRQQQDIIPLRCHNPFEERIAC